MEDEGGGEVYEEYEQHGQLEILERGEDHQEPPEMTYFPQLDR